MAVSGLSVSTNLLTESDCPTGFQRFVVSLSVVGMVMTTSAGFSISCRDSISGRVSTSGIAAEFRQPRICDLRIMVEVISVRLTSPERVTTGVGDS